MREITCASLGLECDHVARGKTIMEAEAEFWLHARSHHGGSLRLMTQGQRAALCERVEHLAAGPAVTFQHDTGL